MNEKNKKFTRKDIKETINNIKKSYKFVKNNKKELFIFITLSLIIMPISVLTPLLSAKLILNLNNGLYESLLRVAGFIFIIYMFSHIIGFISRIIYKKYIIKVTYGIQKALMQETFKLKTSCFDEYGTGLFTERLRQDTYIIANVFDRLLDIIIQIMSSLGIFIVIFITNKIIFFYFLLNGLKDIIISKIRINNYYKSYAKIRDLEENNTSLIAELIRGIRDIKVLNSLDVFLNKFDKRVNEVNDENIKLTIKNNKFYLLSDTIDEIMEYLFFFLGVLLVTKKLLLPEEFIILYMYKSKTKYFFNHLTNLFDYVKNFNFSANRVFEIIESDKFEKERFGNIELKNIKGNFSFKNVSFAYKNNKEILHNISFDIKANTTVAFVGATGSGKSTILNLLCKLYDIPDNKIFIDNYDINTLTKDSIRNNISVITQNPYVFNLSIKDNLLLVKENVSEKEMIKACKRACLHDFIMSLPNGYDTIIGEGGVTLSGGERQRLAIARALIKKTEIILFDEATSALDNQTQEKIQQSIQKLKGEYTILIIAHRLSTIINSDQIIMIDKGKIVKQGTHQELMNFPKYKKLYQADLLK